MVREFTLTKKVESRQTLDALKRVREDVAESKFKTDGPTSAEASHGCSMVPPGGATSTSSKSLPATCSSTLIFS